MYTVKFSNGQSLQFPTQPTQQDVEEATIKLGWNQKQSNPGLLSQLAGRAQQLGSDVSRGINNIPGDISAIAHPLTQGNKENIGTDLLYSAGDVGGAIKDVAGAGVSLVNKGLRYIPGVANLEDKALNGISSAIQSPMGQSVIKPIEQFANKNPDIARAYGSAADLAAGSTIAMGTASLANSAKNFITAHSSNLMSHPIAQGLINTGSIPKEEVPTVMQTISSNGAISDNPNVSLNILQRSLEESKNTAQSQIDDLWNKIGSLENEGTAPSTGMDINTPGGLTSYINSDTGMRSQIADLTEKMTADLNAKQQAISALKTMINTPSTPVAAPGLIDHLNSAITNGVKRTIMMPFRHPLISGGTAYGIYRAAGGAPLSGEI